jgi:hypothetical protein
MIKAASSFDFSNHQDAHHAVVAEALGSFVTDDELGLAWPTIVCRGGGRGTHNNCREFLAKYLPARELFFFGRT